MSKRGFSRPRHATVERILGALNAPFLDRNQCYFGGGTRIVLCLDEYRESADIDFLCSSREGYRNLRSTINNRSLGEIAAGKVNAQAVTTGKRIRLLPDVPTAAEAGVAGYKVEGWLGVFVAAGTPSEIVNRISNEIRASVASPEISARIIQLGGEPTPTSAAEFTALVRAEIAHWKDVVVRAKIKVE